MRLKHIFATAALLLAACLPSLATVPIKQSSAVQPLEFFLNTTGSTTGATGLTPTVTISKNGGAFASPSGTVTELGSGWYKIAANATDSNTLGLIKIHATATGADPADYAVYDVVAYDPNDASLLGLTGTATAAAQTTLQTTATSTNGRVTTALPNAAPGASGGLPSIGTGAGQINPDGTGSVPIALGQTLPTTPTLRTVGAAMFYADRQIGRLGTAQGGTTTTITLDASASATDNIYAGHFIVLTGGTGAGQTATISSYVGATKVATISRPGGVAWSTTPDATTTFVIIPVAQSTLLAGQSILASNFVAAPTAVAIRQEIDANSTKLDVTVGSRMASGNVTVGGYAGGASPDALVWSATAATYNGAGTMGQKMNAAGTAGDPLTAAVPGSYGAGSAGAALGAIASLPTASSIANAVWSATMDGSITSKDALVVVIANILGAGTNSYNAGAHTLTTIKRRQDGTTPAYTSTTTLNAGAPAPNPAAVTVTPGTLP